MHHDLRQVIQEHLVFEQAAKPLHTERGQPLTSERSDFVKQECCREKKRFETDVDSFWNAFTVTFNLGKMPVLCHQSAHCNWLSNSHCREDLVGLDLQPCDKMVGIQQIHVRVHWFRVHHWCFGEQRLFNWKKNQTISPHQLYKLNSQLTVKVLNLDVPPACFLSLRPLKKDILCGFRPSILNAKGMQFPSHIWHIYNSEKFTKTNPRKKASLYSPSICLLSVECFSSSISPSMLPTSFSKGRISALFKGGKKGRLNEFRQDTTVKYHSAPHNEDWELSPDLQAPLSQGWLQSSVLPPHFERLEILQIP